jgi:hypothetical protein
MPKLFRTLLFVNVFLFSNHLAFANANQNPSCETSALNCESIKTVEHLDKQSESIFQALFAQLSIGDLPDNSRHQHACDADANRLQASNVAIETTETKHVSIANFSTKLLNNQLSPHVAPIVNETQQFNIGSHHYDELTQSEMQNCTPSEVPIPAAAWLFGTALVGFVSLSTRRKI